MRKGGGKAKGSQFERDICRALSSWLTAGAREDVLWRSAMSGGRATVGKKAEKSFFAQAGDVSSVSSEGFPLTNRFFIELKFYADLGIQAMPLGIGKLYNFWNICCEESSFYKKAPLLIAKQNRYPTMLCTNTLGSHFLNLKIDDVPLMFPNIDMRIVLFDQFIGSPATATRLFHYDYSSALSSYRLHRSGAAQRGIEFDFEFDNWVSWWETELGPEWQRLRGRRRGQYVMARNEDTGPYAHWNVHCCTQEDNISEKAVNGTAARGEMIATNKLTEADVISIFYDKRDPALLAKHYGVHRSNIYLIKHRKTWRHILSAKRPRKRIK